MRAEGRTCQGVTIRDARGNADGVRTPVYRDVRTPCGGAVSQLLSVPVASRPIRSAPTTIR